MKKITLVSFFLLLASFAMAQQTVDQMRNDKSAHRVKIVTSKGEMVALLYDDTPEHRDNFLKLAKQHFYDSLLFHRVIRDFMIQGGDPDSRDAKPGQMLGNGSLGYTLPAEFVPSHVHRRGALCAARLGDNVNPAKRSSSTQFYIVQGRIWQPDELEAMAARAQMQLTPESRKIYTHEGGAPHLDGSYTVFGQIIEGLDVIDRIAEMNTDRFDRPLQDVYILRVEILQ